jgi:hypothetical protein
MKVTEPNSAKPTIKPTAQEIAKTRLANRRSGRIGSSATCSTAMNPASAASVPAARLSAAGEVQAIVFPPRLARRISAVSVAARSAAPAMSMLGRRQCARRAKRPADDDERDEAERQIDVEDPAPAQLLDEKPADQRAHHGREAEDAAKDALELATLARGEEIADHRHRGHDQPAAAEPLHGAEDDELRHRAAEPA